MLSMIQGEVVTRYGWLTPQEFTDIVAISQMTPGPIGINSATYVGYSTIAEQYGTSMGVLGSCVATFAVVLPSFILMLTISKFFLKYQKHPAATMLSSFPLSSDRGTSPTMGREVIFSTSARPSILYFKSSMI